MNNNNIKLLYCRNQEWIEQHHDIPTGYEDEYVSTLVGTLIDALVDAGYDVERGTTQYHEWNGAHFTHRFGEIATYAELSAEQVAEIWEIVEVVHDAISEMFEVHRLAEQIGTDIGNEIAYHTTAYGLLSGWPGLSQQVKEQVERMGFSVQEVENYASTAFNTTLNGNAH